MDQIARETTAIGPGGMTAEHVVRLPIVGVRVTAHTARIAVFGVLTAAIVQVLGATTDHTDLLARGWPEVLSIALGLAWLRAGYNDFASGLHLRLPNIIHERANSHPFVWYRAYLKWAVVPWATLCGYVLPGGMIAVGGSYLTGILVPVAAAGGLFMVANMALFQALQRSRDAFLLLSITQAVILATGPGGIQGLIDLAA